MVWILCIPLYKCHLGIPVATVAINGAKNAAILATSILAVGNDDIKEKLVNFKSSLKDAVTKKDEKLQNLGYEAYLARNVT